MACLIGFFDAEDFEHCMLSADQPTNFIATLPRAIPVWGDHMRIEITAITSSDQWHALRAKVVGASEAGALVGEHEYLSYWALWARKSGKLAAHRGQVAMERGRYLEPVAAQWIPDRYPTWDVVAPHAHYADHRIRHWLHAGSAGR